MRLFNQDEYGKRHVQLVLRVRLAAFGLLPPFKRASQNGRDDDLLATTVHSADLEHGAPAGTEKLLHVGVLVVVERAAAAEGVLKLEG